MPKPAGSVQDTHAQCLQWDKREQEVLKAQEAALATEERLKDLFIQEEEGSPMLVDAHHGARDCDLWDNLVGPGEASQHKEVASYLQKRSKL